jgi:transposase
MTRGNGNSYSPEVRKRAVRMVMGHRGEYASEWEAISSIASKIGCKAETLRLWVRRAERDAGLRPGHTSEEHLRIKELERENRELRRPTRSCARLPLILPRRRSTAGSSHDRLHRRSPRGAWGRADLQGAADRPADLL